MRKKISYIILSAIFFTACFKTPLFADNAIPSAYENTEDQSLSPIAFPSAQGGGMYSKGARGSDKPEIFHVTNLEDSGKGSLRDALSRGGRIVVFDVGGNIKLKKTLQINSDNITILGQTAPGDGISIDGECLKLKGSNIIMRYLRIRGGFEREGSVPEEADTVTVLGGNNIIIDHCSMSWSVDECLSVYAVKNFTVQWSIISESLNNSIHTKGPHGMGGIWGGINTSAHHNLMSCHNNRNPMVGTGATVSTYKNTPDTDGLVDIRNNVIYNWGNSTSYGGQNGVRVNLVGNYYRPGPATKINKMNTIFTPHGTSPESPSLMENGGSEGGGKGKIGWSTTLFADKNYVENSDDITADNYLGVKPNSSVGLWENAFKKLNNIEDGIYVDGVLKPNDQYIYDYPIITQNAEKAYKEVIEYAGASNIRDTVDTRVINDVINKTAPTGSKSGLGLVDSIKDVGGYPVLKGGEKPLDSDNDGMPDYWEDNNGYDKNNPDDSVIILPDGYTPIEKYGEYLILSDNKSVYDKAELLEELYKDLKIKKYGYTEKSWADFTKALENAQDIAGASYPSEDEISLSLESLKSAAASLENDDKYYLKEIISQGESLNPSEYIQDSFNNMLNYLSKAIAVRDNANADKSEIDEAFNNLKSSIDNLSINYKYKLEKEIEKSLNINQMLYSIESMNILIDKINIAKKTLEADSSDDELKAQYENLKILPEKMTLSSDKDTRITGDFENMLCHGFKTGTYGNFRSYSDKETNSFFIKENIAGNSSKSLIINDESESRLSLTQTLDKKQSGIIKLKGDFCFLSKPTAETIFFRVADSDYSGLSSNNLFDVSVRTSKGNSYLQFRNYTTSEIESSQISDIPFEENKWYTIEVDIDTVKKLCSVILDNKTYIDPEIMTLYADNIGISRFAVETPGKLSAILAADNITTISGDKKYDVYNLKISDNWTNENPIQVSADVINYVGGEKTFLIAACYNKNKLIDYNIQKINSEKNSITKNLTSSLKLKGDIKDCKIKIFIWNESMIPYYYASYYSVPN